MLPLMSDLTGAKAVGPRTSVRSEKAVAVTIYKWPELISQQLSQRVAQKN